MKNKGFIYTLLIIIIAGIAITMSTSRVIDRSREQSIAAVTAGQTEIPAAGAVETEAEIVMEAAVAAQAMSGPEAAAPAYKGAMEEAAAEADMPAEEVAATEMAPVMERAIGPGMVPSGTEGDPGDSRMNTPAEHMEPASDGGSADAERKAVSAEAEKKTSDSVVIPLSPLEPAVLIEEKQEKDAVPAEHPVEAVVESSYYMKRLRELDVQIQKGRENQSVANNYSAKKAAENELKLWDNELNAIYGEIMERLDISQASSLVDEEREWMKERDRLAAEAAKASAGGSMESVEYTLSLAESTRQRSYELIELYGHLLSE